MLLNRSSYTMLLNGLFTHAVGLGTMVFLSFHVSVFLRATDYFWPPPGHQLEVKRRGTPPEDMTGRIHPALPEHFKQVAVLSTVLNIHSRAVYQKVNSWCEHMRDHDDTLLLDFYIVHQQAISEDQLQQCSGRLHLIQEPSSNELPENRIDRLAFLRNKLRQDVIDNHTNTTYDAVVVVDLDMNWLPSAAQFTYGLEQLASYDIVCGNGYEVLAGMRQSYDIYALVETTGKFRYAEEALSPIWLLTAQQPQIYLKIMADKTYDAQSCFSGMAIYKADVYFDTRCNYEVQPVPLDDYKLGGKVCEHVVFHLCLRHYNSHLHATILADMPLERTSDWEGRVIATAYITMVYGGSSLLLVIVWGLSRFTTRNSRLQRYVD